MQDSEGQNVLHIACQRGAVWALKLFQNTPGLQVPDVNGNMPLHVAMANRNAPELVAELLKHKDIDVKVQDSKGRNALHIACQHGAVWEIGRAHV